MPVAEPEVETHSPPQVHKDPASFQGWMVIVLNDNHNSFEHVVASLARVIPDIDLEKGWQLAWTIHLEGSSVVWQGVREVAEFYWEQLHMANLTMAPLHQNS